MNEVEFRRWLEENFGTNTVSTKLSEARQLSRSYGDLDALYDYDHLDSLLEDLRYSAADKAQGRPNPSKVQLTSDLYRDLSNLRTTVSYYRAYRGMAGRPKPDAAAVNQAIDECAAVGTEVFLKTYGFGPTIDYWVMRDGQPFPSKAVFGISYQFMDGGAPLDGKLSNGTVARKHLEKLGFEISKGVQAEEKGSRPFVLYDIAGDGFQPVRHGSRTGPSVFKAMEAGESNPPNDILEVETITEIAKAMLVDGLSARVQSINKGPVNYMGYARTELVRYELDPSIALEIHVPARGSLIQSSTSEGSSPLQQEIRDMTAPTNLILYGPPGTGKTYRTVAEAVRLCDGLSYNNPLLTNSDRRAELKQRYDDLCDQSRIGFVTFHQSYSYEDFIEGLRPPSGDDAGEGGLRLNIHHGIFREMVTLAQSGSRGGGDGSIDLDGRRFFKMSLGRAGVEDDIYDSAIEGGYVTLGWGGQEDWSDPKYDGDAGYQAIFDRWNDIEPGTSGNSGNIVQVFRFRSSMRKGDIVIVSYGNSHVRAIGEITGDYRYVPADPFGYHHHRDVKWLRVFEDPIPASAIFDQKLVQMSCYQLKDAAIRKDALLSLIGPENERDVVPLPYVLIIDEINRANISKVFGELITLIEPDKRLGMSNALKVKLPYSQDEFGVPANLHIIGTMNTADRSIALLDTALRRRFAFEEIAPKPKLLTGDVDGVPLQNVLQTINDRIEYLLDREHRIGHAYFMGNDIHDRAAVDAIMHDKVIPLLQEYFFEDWARVAAVLGGRENHGGGFLDCRPLPDPTGQGGEPRYSWSVKKTFDVGAYAQLVRGAAQAAPGLGDVQFSDNNMEESNAE